MISLASVCCGSLTRDTKSRVWACVIVYVTGVRVTSLLYEPISSVNDRHKRSSCSLNYFHDLFQSIGLYLLIITRHLHVWWTRHEKQGSMSLTVLRCSRFCTARFSAAISFRATYIAALIANICQLRSPINSWRSIPIARNSNKNWL